MQAVPKLPIVLALTALTGCASIFRSSPPSAQIIGPEGISVRNMQGEELPLHHDGTNTFVYPRDGHADSVAIVYRGKTQSVGLAKQANGWMWLDLFAGPGFIVDDISHSWYSFRPIYVSTDSSGSGSFVVTSSNWLGESAGKQRPKLLLLLGLGSFLGYAHPIGQDYEENNGEPYLAFLYNFQFGAGADFYKKVEVFYLFQNEPEFNLSVGDHTLSSQITSHSIAGRLFVKDNFYMQASLGLAHAAADIGLGTASSKAFPAAGAAIGWAGDISYVALQYSLSTDRFDIADYKSLLYHSAYLTAGLNVRF